MLYTCRSTTSNKWTTLTKKEVYNEEGCSCVVAGGIWEGSIPSFQICCEFNIALKKVLKFSKNTKKIPVLHVFNPSPNPCKSLISFPPYSISSRMFY